MDMSNCLILSTFLFLHQTTTIAELISRGVKEFFPDKFVVAPAE